MRLVFLCEEPSMKYFLDGFLPRLLPKDIDFITIKHDGKSDLEKSIPVKLQGWNEPDVRFFILQDQDSNDCHTLKDALVELVRPYNRDVVVRIVCHELESWYLGDLKSLDISYGCNLAHLQNKRKFRDPDHLGSPKAELRKMVPRHQQISGAQLLGPIIDIENNTSVSFHFFVEAVQKVCKEIGL